MLPRSDLACGDQLYDRGLQRLEAMLYAVDRWAHWTLATALTDTDISIYLPDFFPFLASLLNLAFWFTDFHD